ncbi:cold shock domain-containing protein [Desulfobacterota bacterium AH_259_B03_O07]|nr:cold shock domain-containing protein [Desulfobacterota bacterium AH_259_B03_O07]
MIKGKIKKVIQERGHGFIRADDGRGLFFHMSRLQDLDIKDIKEEDPVEFDVKEDPHGRGPRAVNVRSLRLRRKRKVSYVN